MLTALLTDERAATTINLAPPLPPHRTAMLEATWYCKLDCVRVLLEQPQIDVLAAEQDGGCALHDACWGRWGRGYREYAKATKLLELLLQYHREHGLTVDPLDCDGCTPLCFAAAAEGDQSDYMGHNYIGITIQAITI